MAFDWQRFGWNLQGAFTPKTTSFINDYAVAQDRSQYFRDHHKNTGRTIKYSWMRGYNPQQQAWKQGRDIMSHTRDMLSFVPKAYYGKAGKTFSDIMEM